MTIRAAASMLRDGQLSAAELVERHLDVIDRAEPRIGAFITVCADAARNAARAADALFRAGHDLGPLQGIPVAVKDNIDVAGVRTTVGSAVLADNVAQQDAAVVRSLRGSAAVIVGKTNLHEFTLGGTTINPHYGTTRNPWDPDRFVAGSSGGSAAAVAAGECLGALGSDTSGSIRYPAAMTGITGLRPTFGLVDTAGLFPLAPSIDTVGPMGRTVDDVAVLLQCIAPQGIAPRSTAAEHLAAGAGRRPRPVRGAVVGVLRDFAVGRAAPGVRSAFATALADLEALGAHVVDVPPPPELERLQELHRIRLAEAEFVHRSWFPSQADRYGPDVRANLEAGAGLTSLQYLEAVELRRRITDTFRTVFQDVDVLATPTAPFVATPVGQDWVVLDGEREPLLPALLRCGTLASWIGSPALSLPCGFADGLPVGLQLIGRPWQEEFLLELGRRYERIHDWPLHLPPPLDP
jgi:aspartyl-tRNA(Asn)/glutamyl-tRNA(Gln) amidotransferase subunit A